MHMKLYNKLKTKSEVFNYSDYQKMEVQKKLEEATKSRLQMDKKKVSVNQEIFDEMKEKSMKGKKDKQIDPFFTLAEDDRFKDMFKN